MRHDLPTGTVTFVFTDVAASTRLLHELGAERYAEALTSHRRVVRDACAAHGGSEVDTQGDAFFLAFPTAPGAVAAARRITEGLDSGPIKVRIGLHTGTPLVTDEGYVGADVHRAARIAAVGHAAQVLVSASTAALVGTEGLRDLGEHRLKDLSAPERIFQLGEAAHPPLKSLYWTNLPVPATPFLGREKELAEVVELLSGQDAHLVTLTGPGGTGKTRLAAQAAGLASESFPDGVYWVGLAALRDPSLVVEAIAQAVGARNGVAEHIGEQELLVLLDNLEQVIEAAPNLSALLSTCPRLTLLITSRELLRIRGEIEYPVPPLARAEAVSLFCTQARLEPSEEIAQLCSRLDDLPLAVELAAARTKAFSPSQILERVSHRLDLLKGGRDAEARQRTLWATVEWSYELLDAAEQRLFRKLSVFAGGSTLEAAEEVVGADLDTLQSLVEKSLVRFTNERYWMLETIRLFATHQLVATGEASEVRDRHARWFAEIVEHGSAIRDGDTRAFREVAAEEDNIRAALRWLHESGDAAAGLLVAGGVLAYFWWARGQLREARSWIEGFMSLGDDLPPRLTATALSRLSFLTSELGDPDLGIQHAKAAVAMWRDIGDNEELIRALNGAGCGFLAAKRYEEACGYFDEAMARAFQFGHEVWVGTLSANKAEALESLGKRDAARTLLTDALRRTRESGSRTSLITLLPSLGVLDALEDRPEAREELREGLKLARELGFASVVPSLLAGYAAVAARSGLTREGVILASAAGALAADVGDTESDAIRQARERALSAGHALLDAEELRGLRERGESLEVEEAVELALSLG